jgi:hypothetical protein
VALSFHFLFAAIYSSVKERELNHFHGPLQAMVRLQVSVSGWQPAADRPYVNRGNSRKIIKILFTSNFKWKLLAFGRCSLSVL